MISCSLSPNTELDDVLVALRVFCQPWMWKQGSAIGAVEKYFGGASFNSGRTALRTLLVSFGIGGGDEVIVQAFTCVAVPNAVIAVGATPVYADITPSYNMDPR